MYNFQLKYTSYLKQNFDSFLLTDIPSKYITIFKFVYFVIAITNIIIYLSKSYFLQNRLENLFLYILE